MVFHTHSLNKDGFIKFVIVFAPFVIRSLLVLIFLKTLQTYSLFNLTGQIRLRECMLECATMTPLSSTCLSIIAISQDTNLNGTYFILSFLCQKSILKIGVKLLSWLNHDHWLSYSNKQNLENQKQKSRSMPQMIF